LAAALSALASDPARRAALGRSARLRAERDWSREVILAQLERDLGQLCR
jgi:hypothetical protein